MKREENVIFLDERYDSSNAEQMEKATGTPMTSITIKVIKRIAAITCSPPFYIQVLPAAA